MAQDDMISFQGDRELFLETLFKRSKDGILGIDREGLVLFANPAAKDMFADQVEDLLGYQIGMPAIEDDVELRIPRGDEIRTVEMRSSHMIWEGQPIYLVMLRDVTNRVKVEQELRKREVLLRETGQMARVGGWEIDFEANTVWWSDVTRQIHEVQDGYEPTLGEAVSFFPPEVRPTLQEAIQWAREEGVPYDLELPFVTAQGKDLWVRAIGKRKRLPGGKMRVHGTFQDITDRKEARDRLWESEQKFRHLFEHSINGFALHEIITDENGDPVDYVYLDVNQAFEDHTGLKPEDVVGKRASDIFGQSEESSLIDRYVPVALTGEPTHFEFYSAQLDRHFLISAYSPREGQFATLFHDISQRKQAEKAIKKSEEKFRTLYETMSQGVVYQNAEGEIISANPAAGRILGLSLDQMKGKTSLDPDWSAVDLDGNPLPGEEHPAMVALRTGEPVENFVFGVYRPDKEVHVWISVSAIPQFREGEEEPYQVFTTFLDITDRVRAEKELKERVKELRCIAAVSAEIQREPTLEELGQRTVELLIPAMQQPELTIPVVTIDGQRFENERYHPALNHSLRAEIRGKHGSHGSVVVYYTENKPFLIPEEQELLDRIAEMLGLWHEQAHAQRKLRESEEQLDLAIQSAELGIWDWDLVKDTLTFNELFTGILNYRPDEVEGDADFWRDHIHPDDSDRVQEAVNAHLNGETSLFQSRHRLLTKGGEAIHVLSTGKVMERSGQGEPERFVGVDKEITELVQAEEDLRFQANLLDAVGQAVIATDAKGHINYWNRAAEELYGWSTDEVQGKNILDVTPTGATRKQAEEIMSTLMAGEIWSGEFEVQRRDSSSFPAIITDSPILNEEGDLKGIIGVTTDISARVEAEQARRRSEHRFRALIENAQDMITIVDKKGTIVYNSPAIQRGLGYSPEELEGNSAFEMIHPGDQTRVMAYLQDRMNEPGAEGRIEYRMQHKEGGYRIIESVGRKALHDPSVKGIVINSRDITQRKENEEMIKRQVEQLSIQYQIASLGVETVDEDVVIQEATRLIDETFSPQNCGVFFYDEGKGVIENHPSYSGEGQHQSLVLKPGEGIIGAVLESGQSTYLPDVDQSDKYITLNSKVRSKVCVPLKTEMDVIGVFNIERGETEAFSEDEIRSLESIGNQLATTLSKIQTFEAAQRRLDRLQVLRDIDQAISGSLDLKTTLNVIADRILHNLAVDACSVLLYDPLLQTLEYEIGKGFRSEMIPETSLRLGEGLAGRAVLERKMIIVSDLAQKTVRSEYIKLVRKEGFEEYIGVPLIAKGEILGVLEIFHRSTLDTPSEWLDFLETLAGQAAIAIDRLQLFHDLERSNIDLMRAYNEVIEGWARALELRDQETEGHSRRVEQLTLEIAKRMGVGGKKLAHIRQGALLHDIGKMGIPDHILHKPGKLSEEEWTLMRKHPTFAYEMLSPVDYLQPALDIPYCHHEKWDGSGYPRGLQREEIPLEARIFAVVDVWDALRSDRPYRDAWSDERALDYIKEQSGEHFDPRVVDIFLNIVDQ